MEKIVSLCKRRGFVFPGSEIYGGLAGTWDYGHLGNELLDNIKTSWWGKFVDSRDNMYGVRAAILMSSKVWEASGHVAGFTDPMVECKNCNKRERTDSIINNHVEYRNFVEKMYDQTSDVYKQLKDKFFKESDSEFEFNISFGDKNSKTFKDALNFVGIFPYGYLMNMNVKCQNCGKVDWTRPQQFNMMFKTNVGAVEDSSSVAYLRPETAQGIFANFKNTLDAYHPKLPFGIAQIGKAFRNEITPRDFLFRSREFEQMEIEYFVKESEWQDAFEMWRTTIGEWAAEIGIDPTTVHELEVASEDLAHYSKRTIDFEFDFPFGKKELFGLAYRTDFDLRAHGLTDSYLDEETKEKLTPHVIEPSLGVDRAFLAVLLSAYTEDEMGGEVRAYLKLKPSIAPVLCAVSPLLKNKPELVGKAREVYATLKKKFGRVAWDDNGNIGKRYRRQDEIGTPFCVVVDFDTLEKDDSVSIRHRDDGSQERVKIADLQAYFEGRLA